MCSALLGACALDSCSRGIAYTILAVTELHIRLVQYCIAYKTCDTGTPHAHAYAHVVADARKRDASASCDVSALAAG